MGILSPELLVHSVKEYENALLDLADGDIDFLVERFSGKIRIDPTFTPGSYRVNSQSHVGVIQLPSGSILRCEPKLSVHNIFHMLSIVLRLPSPFLDERLSYDRIDELFDFVAEHFANLVEERLARGLYRSYVEREENLPMVRGRILAAQDIRYNYILRHRTYCRYTEFSWDLPENRVIREAVHVATHLVRKAALRRRFSELDHTLGELDPTPLPLSVFDRFTYHRLNDDYEQIHRLCRLILEGSSVSEELGEFEFRAFLLDMNKLFEQFVGQSLIDRLRPPFSVREQYTDRLDEKRRVKIRPDLLVTRDRVGVLVADCKYKHQTDENYRHADLYQVLAYCTALGIPQGALIYPRWETTLGGQVAIRHSDVRIRHFDVDLSVEHGQLATVMDALADNLAEWSIQNADSGNLLQTVV